MKRLEIPNGFTNVLLVLAGLSACSTAIAQPVASKCHPPKSELKLTVAFEGEYASAMDSVSVVVRSMSEAGPDQQNFATSFGTPPDQAKKIAPGVFTVTMIIPDLIADGEYRVIAVNATSTKHPYANYSAPGDFSAPPSFQICDPDRFRIPKVKVTENP
jgi:hypothetical protein